MTRLLRDGLEAGGIGFSTTTSDTHNDGDGNPVPSRFADRREFIELARVSGEYEGTSLELLPHGATDLGPFDDETAELMIAMSAIAQRPLNWNVIQPDGQEPRLVPRQAGGRRPGGGPRRQGRRSDDAGRHEGAVLVPRRLRARRVRRLGGDHERVDRGEAAGARRPAPARAGGAGRRHPEHAPPGEVARPRDRRDVRAGHRRVRRPPGRRHRRRARQGAVRHAGRHRHRRRVADDVQPWHPGPERADWEARLRSGTTRGR